MKTIFTLILIVSLSFHSSAQWLPLSSGTESRLYSVHFIDNNNGWVAGLDNFINRTYNGGDTWISTGSHGWSTDKWFSIFAINSNEVYACGSTFNVDRWQTNYASTVNGGSSWDVPSSWGSGYGSVRQVFFLNENLGWKVGFNTPSGRMWKTIDGINGWDLYIRLDHNPLSVYFINENIGWVSCQDGFVLTSTDGGETWNEIVTGVTEGLRSIFFINSTVGWAVGYDNDIGVIIKSTDGGATWNQVNHPATMTLHTVQFVNESIGWACGSKVESSEQRGVILYTDDGGENWSEQYVYDQVSSLYSLFFIDGLTGWAVGYNGIMVKTTNAGGTSFEGVDDLSSNNQLTSYAYPNPSSNLTTITYKLKQPEKVTLTIYTHLGKEIEMIKDEQSKGNQQLNWNSDGTPSGMYYYTLKAGQHMSSGKITIVR